MSRSFEGCADLALEADRIPTSMDLAPYDGVFVQGEPARVEVVDKDQNDEVMPVPSWAPPVWTVSDESVAEMGRDGTLTGMKSGEVLVTARLANLKAESRFRFNPDRLHLTASIIYVTQGAQNRYGRVELIAGRTALLRVFAVGDVVSYFASRVRVTLLQGDSVVFEGLGPPPPEGIPTRPDESNPGTSDTVSGDRLDGTPGRGATVVPPGLCSEHLDPGPGPVGLRLAGGNRSP